MKAVQIQEQGGPEVLKVVSLDTPTPSAGEVLVRLEASGINFIDVYQRSGLYKVDLPYVLGLEGAGTVAEVGANVSGFKEGDHVAYTGIAGSYAEYALVPAERLVSVPESVSLETAAAVMLQGMTAQYLSHSTYPIQEDDTCLVHAVAGGVGLLLTQLAKLRGATVIGTASTLEKAERARKVGADHVILYTDQDFEEEVKRLTDGDGVQVVYDSVGKTTFDKSLNCLAPRGYMVLYGQSSGPVGAFDPQILNNKGSLFLTRPSLFTYIAKREELVKRAGELFVLLSEGNLDVHIDSTFPLADVAEAHRKLENRETSGKVLLTP